MKINVKNYKSIIRILFLFSFAFLFTFIPGVNAATVSDSSCGATLTMTYTKTTTATTVKFTVTKLTLKATKTLDFSGIFDMDWEISWYNSYAETSGTLKSGSYSKKISKGSTVTLFSGSVSKQVNKVASSDQSLFISGFMSSLATSCGLLEWPNAGVDASMSLAKYTVSYNANGGSGAPSSQTKWYGKTLTLTSSKPTRNYYTFSKWNTVSGGTGTNYSSGGSYTANASATLYAQWVVAKVNIVYNANGGTIADSPHNYNNSQYFKLSGSTVQKSTTVDGTYSSPFHTINYNNNVNLYNVSTFNITRAGYHIDGATAWNTAANGTGTSYNQDTDYSWGTFGASSGDSTKTLYVNWKGNSYTIKFNANGGEGTTPDQTMTYGQSMNLNPNAFTKSGSYAFAEWNTQADGSGTSYADGDVVKNLVTSGTFNLYAQWVEKPSFTLTANANGGTIPATTGWTGTGSTATKTVVLDLPYRTLPTPTRTGYTFSGWSYLPSTYKQVEYIEGTGTQYIDSGYKPKAITGVSATYQFTEVATLQQRVYGTQGVTSTNTSIGYALYINGAGGWSYAYNDGEGNWVAIGVTADPGKHTFRLNVNPGYYSLDNGLDTAMSGSITKTSLYNLYIMAKSYADGAAQFGKLKLYDFMIFESGTALRKYVPCYRVSDSTTGLCDMLNNSTFYPGAGTGTLNKGSAQYLTEKTIVSVPQNHTIYAHWTKNTPSFTDKTITKGYSTSAITENVTAPTNGTGNYTYEKTAGEDDITVSSAGVITIPASKAPGTYTVSIKATDSNLGTSKTATYTINIKPVYQVKFNANGGSGSMSNQSFMLDESKTLSTNTFTKSGYNFIGWNTQTDGTGTWYMPGKAYKNLSSTNGAVVNVYAQWRQQGEGILSSGGDVLPQDEQGNYVFDNLESVPYTIRYNVNGGVETFGYDERVTTSNPWSYSDGVWRSYNYTYTYTFTSSMTSKTFTLTSSDTLTFQWAVSSESLITTYYDWDTDHEYPATYGAYLYYTITKDGETLTGTGESTKITGNSNVTSESGLTYTTITKTLEPGTYTVTFTYKNVGHQTDASQGLNKGFVKNFDLTSNSFFMSNQSFAAGDRKALSKSKYSRLGYTFAGWSKSASASEAEYGDEEVVINVGHTPNEIVDLYAVWEPIPEYQVSLTVVNGTILGDSTKMAANGSKPEFSVRPNPNYGYYANDGSSVGSMSCTNEHILSVTSDNQTATIGAGFYGYMTSGIKNTTSCTLTFKRITGRTYTTATNDGTILLSSSTNTCTGDYCTLYTYCCGTNFAFNASNGKFTVNGTYMHENYTGTKGKYCIDSYVSSTSDYGTACLKTDSSMRYVTTTCKTTSTDTTCHNYYWYNSYSGDTT